MAPQDPLDDVRDEFLSYSVIMTESIILKTICSASIQDVSGNIKATAKAAGDQAKIGADEVCLRPPRLAFSNAVANGDHHVNPYLRLPPHMREAVVMMGLNSTSRWDSCHI